MTVSLSICIPTFNRARELRDLLDSIAAQEGHTLSYDVVISDNASTDGTEQLVDAYAKRGLPIVYARAEKNRGFDRNVLNVIDMASGSYCWLMGSDDKIEPGAFARVERALTTQPDLTGLSVGTQGYGADLATKKFVVDNVSTQFTAELLVTGKGHAAGLIGPWMGFMSSLIVRRSVWKHAVESSPVEPYLRGYIHLCIVIRMLDADSRWLIVPDRLVGCRTNNDSFIGQDEFSRTRLDIEGFDQAFGDVLGRRSPSYVRAMSMVAGFFVRAHFLGAKYHGVSSRYWRQALPLALRTFWRYPVFWAKVVPIIVTPRPALILARSVRHRIATARKTGDV